MYNFLLKKVRLRKDAFFSSLFNFALVYSSKKKEGALGSQHFNPTFLLPQPSSLWIKAVLLPYINIEMRNRQNVSVRSLPKGSAMLRCTFLLQFCDYKHRVLFHYSSSVLQGRMPRSTDLTHSQPFNCNCPLKTEEV